MTFDETCDSWSKHISVEFSCVANWTVQSEQFIIHFAVCKQRVQFISLATFLPQEFITCL